MQKCSRLDAIGSWSRVSGLVKSGQSRVPPGLARGWAAAKKKLLRKNRSFWCSCGAPLAGSSEVRESSLGAEKGESTTRPSESPRNACECKI